MPEVRAYLTDEEAASLRRYAKLSKRKVADVAGSFIDTALQGADDPEPFSPEAGGDAK